MALSLFAKSFINLVNRSAAEEIIMLNLSEELYTNPTCYNSKSVYLLQYYLDDTASKTYATIITAKNPPISNKIFKERRKTLRNKYKIRMKKALQTLNADTSEKQLEKINIVSEVKNISQIPIEKSMDIFIETPMKKYSNEELLELPGEIALSGGKIIMKRSFIHKR